MASVIRLEPFYYIHVLDQNSNVTRVVVGPTTFIAQDHERVVLNATKMLVIPPRNYAEIKNPVRRDPKTGQIVTDRHGQVVLRFGEKEVRLSGGGPFPLYPGEQLSGDIVPLDLVRANNALRLRALQTFTDEDSKMERNAGDEWLFEGPGLYKPHPYVDKIGKYSATVIKENQALRLMATQDTEDRDGNKRVAGEEWLVRRKGSYLPGVHEKIVSIVNAHILTETSAIHVRALESFKDALGKDRKNGEQFLVRNVDTPSYIPSTKEEVIKKVEITILNSRQYAVIIDPFNEKTGMNDLGQKKLVQGVASFFLKPGERLERGVQNVYILREDEGLILSATEQFVETIGKEKKVRKPGDRWMIRGPCEYVPPVECKVIRKNSAVPLHKNEGIYVRDVKTGRVRAVVGETYLLNENEELWAKKLPDHVERMLSVPTEFGRVPEAELAKMRLTQREPHRVVSYRVPANSCVQIYDYQKKEARVVFGAALVMLGPDEVFTPLVLSGGVPKKPRKIQTLHLMMGPDFCTDVVNVETSDHAKLKLELSYNWRFRQDSSDRSGAKLFNVSDFVGDLCSKCASKVRGAVNSIEFDAFHKNSARMIRAAIFGLHTKGPHKGHVKDELFFPANNLLVTSVDIKAIEPSNSKTRELLQKSVQLAISITTQSQQALAQQEADRRAQVARGNLQRQKINDSAEAEKARKELSKLEAATAAIETTGQARAEAQSLAAAKKIAAQSRPQLVKLAAQAKKLRTGADLKILEKRRKQEIDMLTKKQNLETNHKKDLAGIESSKFQAMIEAIGTQTIERIAESGPEMSRQLVSSMGIREVLITDGKAPVQVFQTGAGFTSNAAAAVSGSNGNSAKYAE